MLAATIKSYRQAWMQLHGMEPTWLQAGNNLPSKALAILMLHQQPLLDSLFHHRPELWNSPSLTDFQHSLWASLAKPAANAA